MDWKKILAFLAPIVLNVLIAVTLKYDIERGHIVNSHFSSLFTRDAALEHLLCLRNTHLCQRCTAVMAGGRSVSSMTVLGNVSPSLPLLYDAVFKSRLLEFISPRRDGLKLSRQHISIISAEGLLPGIVPDGSLPVAGPPYVTALWVGEL